MVKAAFLNPTGRIALRPTKKTCIGMAAAAAGVLALSGGLYLWQTSEMEARQRVVRDRHAQVENADKEVQRLGKVRDEFNATHSQLRFLETSVSPQAYIPTLLKQIEALAKSVDLKVMRFSHETEPAPPPPNDKEARKTWKPQPYDKEHLEMEVQGSYWNVARFVDRLTEFPKIIAVKSVQIVPKDATTGRSPELNVKLRMDGFVFLSDGRKAEAVADPNVPHLLGKGAGSRRRAEENSLIQQTGPQSPTKNQAPR